MTTQAETTPEQTLEQRGARQVVEQISSLARNLSRLQNALAQAAGLRAPAHALLSLVAEAGPQGLTVSEAAQRLGVRPQALTTPSNELCREGFLERLKDKHDGRARRLVATPAGLERLRLSQPLQHRVLDNILARVPATKVAELILNRLDDALQETLQSAEPGELPAS